MRSIGEAAALYIKKGWAVVPLIPGGKACKDDAWTKLIFTPDMFHEGDNIGIKSINGVVDIDCDSPEAVKIAPELLPPTGAVYGRPNKPRAHWLYICPDIKKPIVYKDLGTKTQHATIIEVRVNHQSMAPPSIHPDGQELVWEGPDGPGDAAVVTPDELIRAVRLVATGSLIAAYYNGPGDRHEWGLALAGTLRHLGLTHLEAEKVVSAAGKVRDDEKVRDRLDALRTTYQKADDDPVKSLKSLETLTQNEGKAFVKSLRRLWNAEGSGGISVSRLEELNSRHAVVFQQSGQLVVLTEDQDRVGHKFVRYSRLQDIRDLYPQQVITGFTAQNAPIMKKLGAAWLESPERRQYNGVELAPSPDLATPGYYNLWQGYSVEPKKGSWSLFHDHIFRVIASGNEAHATYILDWMARAVQRPGVPAETAIAIRGGQGTGKTTFARWFGKLFGPHFLHLDSPRQLIGNFNAHLHNAIVVFADEAIWAGDKSSVGVLRRMITESTLNIERKGLDIITVRNVIHLLLASNEDWIVPAALDERRFAVFDIDPLHKEDHAYFAAIEKELFHHGGLEALLFDLLERKISVNLRIIPKTKALDEQKERTASPYMKWWHQIISDGSLWTKANVVKNGCHRIERDLLYENYVQTLDKVRQHQARGMRIDLGRFLHSVMPAPYPTTARNPRDGSYYWVVPSLEVCRRFYEAVVGLTNPEWEVIGETDGELPF